MDDDIPLPKRFSQAQKLVRQIETHRGSSTEQQEMVSQALASLSICSLLVDSLNVFSINEEIEDINTSDLKYLLVQAYLGSLCMQVTDMDNRIENLNKARHHLMLFLTECELHGALSSRDKREVDEVIAKPKGAPEKLDREQKIAKYKRQKESEQKIRDLTQQLEMSELRDDEEVERELVLALIDLHIQHAYNHFEMMQKELEILEHMAQLKEKHGHVPVPQRPATQPLKPIHIANTKELHKQQVFQKGWRQPTMSLDQYIELERQKGNILSGGGNSEAAENKEEDDSEEAADRATAKAREWDEFTDYNPKGVGNRYNRS
eukprot:Lithocolla_globosa_v1_NODE_2813_length_1860_cov_31.424377.p1 type:complete len:320 gc:universal NODE_2813_length_1860_cov_31.424377:1781-822(-)